jgi:hypothetical protein
MKRQRSRNRSGGGGGGKPQHNANRAFESNGPDGVKIRGAAQHVFEKYQQFARDALTAGDRVLAESHQQHAEHYFRVLRAVQPQRPASDIMGRDAFASGVDIDFEDENGDGDGGQENGEADTDRAEPRNEWRQESRQDNRYEQPRRDDRPRERSFNRDERPRDDRQRDDRQRDDRPREDRQARDDRPRDDRSRDDRPSQRDERPRDDRQRDERPRDDRQSSDRQPADRQRDERPREERPERQRNDRYRDDRARDERRADPLPVVEPRAAPLTVEAEQPSSPVLRSQDGGTSHAPAFLQPRAEVKPETTSEEAEPKPRARRRRAPRTFEGAAGEAVEAPSSNADASEKT